MRSFSRLNGVPLYVAGYEKAVNYKAPDKFYPFLGSSIIRKLQNDESNNKRNAMSAACKYDAGTPAELAFQLHAIQKSETRKKRRMLSDSESGEHSLHVLSERSANKIREKLTAFFDAAGGQKTFCTLTFINSVSDEIAIKCLNKFLTVLRKEHAGTEYLWIAERQTKNEAYPDNIHFHIMLNKRLNIFRFNKLWTIQQYNSGITHNKYSKAQVERWTDIKNSGLHPVDVKKVYTIDGLAQYLTKYVTKQRVSTNEKKQLKKDGSLKEKAFKCRAWHCTRGVSKLFTRSVITRECYNEYDSSLNRHVDKETGEVFERYKIKNDYTTVIYIRNKHYFKKYLQKMKEANKILMAGGCVNNLLFELTKEQYYYNYVYELRKGKAKEQDETSQLKGNRLYEVPPDKLRYREALEASGFNYVESKDNHAELVRTVIRNRDFIGEVADNGGKWLILADAVFKSN